MRSPEGRGGLVSGLEVAAAACGRAGAAEAGFASAAGKLARWTRGGVGAAGRCATAWTSGGAAGLAPAAGPAGASAVSAEARRSSAERSATVGSCRSRRARVNSSFRNCAELGAARASTSAFHCSSWVIRPLVPSSVWSERMSFLAAMIWRSTLASSARSVATRSDTM
jgi:hypothetical protein